MLLSRSAFPASALVFSWFSAVTLAPSAGFAAVYTYIDDAGVQTFTNQLHSIPEKYRSQLTPQELEAPPSTPAPRPAVSAEAPARSAGTRVVTAVGEYRMGDHDTRTDALRMAVEAAKKDALEQVATYLETVTEVRDLNVMREDIRSYTAGIVRVVNQTITTRLEQERLVIRADLTAEIDPHEVAQAIAALRENESAGQELLALRAETDRLQEQLDAVNRALAAASSSEETQQLHQQREDMLNDLQANTLLSQAWTSWTYPTVSLYSFPWIAAPGVNGLLLQAQRLSPRHRHLPLARQTITEQAGRMPFTKPGNPPPRHSLLVPSLPPGQLHQAPPLLNAQGVPAKVGDVVNLPAQRSGSPVMQQPIPSSPQPQLYQLHPSHFWRPSPPNIHSAPSIPPPTNSVSPQRYGGQRSFGGGGRSTGGSSRGGSGGRGR